MTDTYYGKRWEMFIDDVTDSLEEVENFDEKAFHKKVTAFEWEWVSGDEKYPAFPVGNSVEIAGRLLQKYQDVITADQ